MTKRRTDISPERRGLFTFGTVLLAIGGVGLLVCFVGFAASGMFRTTRSPQIITNPDGSFGFRPEGDPGNPFVWWFGALGCGLLTVVGQGLRHVAARGLAGSGVVLDPEAARQDLEPWARMGGGMLKDAIDESGIPLGGAAAEPAAVKVRCRKCKALNAEAARFCDQCGVPL